MRPSSGPSPEASQSEDPRRQPGQHQLQVPPLRHVRPGRAGPGPRGDRADRLAERQGRHQVAPGRARAGRADRRPRRGRAALPRPADRPRDRRARRRLRGLGDRVQGGPRAEPHRRPHRGRVGPGRDGGLRRRRPRAQPAVHPRDADAPRPLPATAAGRRLRDRLPPDDPRGQSALCDPRRLGDRAGHPPMGIPRRQPSLHRLADARAARPHPTSR